MDIFSSGERERLGGRGRGRLGGRGQGRVSGGRSIGGSGAMNMKQQGSDQSSSFSQGSTTVPFGNSSGYVGQNTKPHKTPPRQTFGKIQPPSVPLEYSPPQGWGELGSSPFQSLTRSSDMSTAQSQQSRWAESSGSEQGYSHMFSTSTSSRGDGGNGWPRGYRDGKDQEVGRGRGRGRGRDTIRPPPYSTAGSFSCRVCNASFESKTSLVLHLKEKQHFNTASSDQSGGESDTKGPFSRQDSGDSGSSWGGRGQGDNGGRGKPGPRRTYSCRVCNTVFDSNSALYAHLKSEGHFNTSSQPPAIGNQVNADDSDGQMHYGLPPRHSNSHVPAKSEKHVHSTENRHLRENAVLQPAEGTPAIGGGKSFGSGALQPAEGTPAFVGGKSHGSGALQPAEGTPAFGGGKSFGSGALQPAEGTPAFGGGKSFGSGALQPAEGTPAFVGGKSHGSGALQPAEGTPAFGGGKLFGSGALQPAEGTPAFVGGESHGSGALQPAEGTPAFGGGKSFGSGALQPAEGTPAIGGGKSFGSGALQPAEGTPAFVGGKSHGSGALQPAEGTPAFGGGKSFGSGALQPAEGTPAFVGGKSHGSGALQPAEGTPAFVGGKSHGSGALQPAEGTPAFVGGKSHGSGALQPAEGTPAFGGGKSFGSGALQPAEGTPAFVGGKSHGSGALQPAEGIPALARAQTRLGNKDSISSSSLAGSVKNSWRNTIGLANISGKNRDETTDDSPSNSSKFSSYSTATNVPVPSGGLQNGRARQMTTPSPVVPLELHADGQIVGTCEDMCPREEIVKRVRQSDVHLFEQPLEFDERLEAGTVLEDEFVNTLHRTMIKQLQKSSADHTLAIPHLVRTPRALLRTIDYMDENVMSLDLEVKEDEDPARGPIALDVYHFVWNRYRMIAKDFILQNYRFGGRLDAFCVECHERMTRWHIMMDHQMLWSEYYVKQDAYQHQEQLNKLLKTLNELYDEASNRRQMKFENPDTAVDTVDVPNEGEFRSYYILYQLDNEGEVEKYIQTIGEEVLAHPSIQFALKVVRARRVGNYAAFFRLLRTSNFLQACALFKYVGFMRMEALKVMNRVLRSGKQEVNFPISDLVRMLMFEDESDAADFTEQCGLEVMESPENDGESQIIFNGRIDCSSVPTTRQMERGIAERVSHLSRAEVSQGLASGAVLFNAGSSSSSDSSTPPFQCARSNVSKPQTPQRTSSKLLPSRTQVSPTRVPSPGSPRGEIAESLLTKKKSGSSLSSISNDGSQGSMEKTSNLSSTVSSSAFGSFGVSSKRQPVPSNSLTSQPPLVDRGGLGNVSFGETSKKGVSDKSTVLGFTNPLAATQLEKSTPVVGVSAPATVEIPKENLRARRMREKAEAEQALLKQKEANMILEQQRIDKEKIDAERREMDRVRRAAEEKAVRQAAVEKEREARRDRELGVLTERCIQRKKKWTLLRVMQHWRKRTQDMVERNARNTLKLMFHLWLKVYERVLERRERLNEQLLSIQAVPNLAHCVDKVGVKRIRLNYKRARESFSFDPSGVVFGGSCIPLYDSARALMSGYAGKWGTRGIAPAVAGDLFIVQCNRMRSLLGRSMIETTTDLGTGPLWEHDLFFKLSILTPTHTTAQWDHSFCLLPNMLRAILCDPEKSVDSECPERISYSTSQEVCGYIGKRPIRRSVHVVVMDGCSGRGGKGIFPRTPVLATLASIVVLPDVTMSVMQAGFNRRCFSEILYDDSIELNVRKYFEDLTASCVELVRKGVPIVIILTREIVRSSQSSVEEDQPRNSANHSYNHEQGPHRSCTNRISTWREISPGDEACDIVSLFIQSIADVSNREVNVQKAYLIEMEMENDDLPVRLSGKGKNNDELFGYTKRGCPLAYALEACQECVLASVQALAGSVAPLPLVQRVGVCDWAEEAVTNAIWSDNEYFSGSDNMRQELDVDDGIEGYVSDTEAKPSGRTVGRRRMRKQECKEMPHFSTSVAQCLERITMCIDACESRIHHTLSILSTSRKRDAHYSIFPLVDFSEGGFVKGSLYENMSGLCTEAEVNSLPVDWTDVNRLKDALSLLSKFRLPQWQTVGSVEVQCEHFCNALNTRGWVVPGGLNGLLSKVVGDNSSKVTASDCKRRRSDSSTLRRISGGESNARFSLLRRWLTILYQRRARDLSSSLRSDRSSYSGQMYLLYPPVDRTSMQVILSDSEIPEDNYPGIKPKRAYSGLHALTSRTAINCNSPIISRKPVEINCQSNSAVNDFWETTFVRSDCECIVTEDHTVVTHKRTRMEMDASECEIVNPLPRAGISILDTSYPECQEKIVASKASQLRADCNEEKRRCAELENTLREDLRRGDLGYTDVLTELRGCVPAYTDVCKIADERLWATPSYRVSSYLPENERVLCTPNTHEVMKFVHQCREERMQFDSVHKTANYD